MSKAAPCGVDSLPTERRLTTGDQPLVLTRLLRELPGRRSTYSGLLADQPIVIKLFVDSAAGKRDFRRERRGVNALAAAQLPTPSVVYLGRMQTGEWCVVTTFLPACVDLVKLLGVDALSQEAEAEQARVGFALGGCLRQLHDSGLIHKDAHLGNFLYQDEQIWLIDGAEVQALDRFRGDSQKLANLGLLLAQLPVSAGKIAEQIVNGYGHQFSAEQISRAINRSRRRREGRYLKKTLRTCSEFVAKKVPGHVCIMRRELVGDEPFEALLADLDGAISNGESLKRGNTATLAKVTLGNRLLVVKRYNVKSWQHRLRLLLRVSRAVRSWQNGYRLRMWGLQTPLPLALVEHKSGSISGTAYLICEYSALTDCKAYWRCHQDSGLLAQALAQMIAGLQALGLSHGDMKADNIKFNGERLELLDLDSLKRWNSRSRLLRAIAQDVERLLRNWADAPAYVAQLQADIGLALGNLKQPFGFTQR